MAIDVASGSVSFVSNDDTSAAKPSTRGRGWFGNSEGHARAGRKGGRKVSVNRSHMAEIGRKGGLRVSQNRAHMATIGRLGGLKAAQTRSVKSAPAS